MHRLTLLGGVTPSPKPQTPVALEYLAAPVILGANVPRIGPPLKGKNLVAFNGCCETSGAHRATSQTVNGGLYFAQRFAIDWMRLDEAGRLVNGNLADVHSWVSYDSDVLQTGTSIAMIEKAYLRFIPSAMLEKLSALKR